MDAFAYGDPYLQFGTKVEKGGRKARCKTGVGGGGGEDSRKQNVMVLLTARGQIMQHNKNGTVSRKRGEEHVCGIGDDLQLG